MAINYTTSDFSVNEIIKASHWSLLYGPLSTGRPLVVQKIMDVGHIPGAEIQNNTCTNRQIILK